MTTFTIAWLICDSFNQPSTSSLVPQTVEHRMLCRACCLCTLNFIIRINTRPSYTVCLHLGHVVKCGGLCHSTATFGWHPTTAAMLAVSQANHLSQWNNAWIWAQRNAAAEWLHSNVVSGRGYKWWQKIQCSVKSTQHAYLGPPCHFGTTGYWQLVCCLVWCRSGWLRRPPWQGWWILWSISYALNCIFLLDIWKRYTKTYTHVKQRVMCYIYLKMQSISL